MGDKFICACGYMWTSRKSFGSPSRCPNCGSKSIFPVSLTIREALPPKMYSGSHAHELYNKMKMERKESETDYERAERMRALREIIRQKVQSEHETTVSP